MKRSVFVLAAFALMLVFSFASSAQMGMDLFRKPSIAKAFNPVVGKGAQYESRGGASDNSATNTMELGVVGKESVDGKEAYWMEIVSTRSKGQTFIGKVLMTKDDFEFHRMISQMPGKPAMEVPYNPAMAGRQRIQEHFNDWHSLGTETVSVPAGSFSCEHWRNDKDNADIWTSDKVTPFGMVKEARANDTMVLVKILSDYPDRITGPVQKFDMQQLMQQMQQRRQLNP